MAVKGVLAIMGNQQRVMSMEMQFLGHTPNYSSNFCYIFKKYRIDIINILDVWQLDRYTVT